MKVHLPLVALTLCLAYWPGHAEVTSDGFADELKFDLREVRYLRVTQMRNTANSGRHLVVMAFEK